MDIRDLVARVDIVDYISQYVDMEERGGEYWGISPFTFPPERTPSFSVRRDPPFFFDYSSGKSGNIIAFIKEYHHCHGKEIVDRLKNFAGIEGDVVFNERLAITSIAKQYAPTKTTKKQGAGVVLPDDFMDRYKKRPDKLKIWEDEGISRASLDKFQVYYDEFSNRLVYPIRDLNGKIINISGRALDPDWKERGERKYTYFYSFGTINTIYGLYENREDIKKQGEVILFEGCKSVLLADTWGIHNTGAILTSHLSENQMKILAKLGYDVVFALDKEIRVKDDKNIRKLSQFVNVYYTWDRRRLLDDKDAPVDKGEEVFRQLYESVYAL